MEVLSKTTINFYLKLESVKYMYLQKENLKTNLRNRRIIPNVKHFAKSTIPNVKHFAKSTIPNVKHFSKSNIPNVKHFAKSTIPNVKHFAKSTGISNRLYIVGFYKQNMPTEKYDDMCCTTWMAVARTVRQSKLYQPHNQWSLYSCNEEICAN